MICSAFDLTVAQPNSISACSPTHTTHLCAFISTVSKNVFVSFLFPSMMWISGGDTPIKINNQIENSIVENPDGIQYRHICMYISVVTIIRLRFY